MIRILFPLLLLFLAVKGGDLPEKSCRYIVRFSQNISLDHLKRRLEHEGFRLLTVYEVLGKRRKEHILLIRGACGREKRLNAIDGLLGIESDHQRNLMEKAEGRAGGSSLLPLVLLIPLAGLAGL